MGSSENIYTYEYRADGMRVWKNDNYTNPGIPVTTRYYYDGQMPIEEDETGGTIRRNAIGARGIDALITTTGSDTTTAFPVYDTHGNMVATLSRSGSSYALANGRSYDVWGSVRSGSSTGNPKGRYVANLGHVADDESSLTYMRARYYEPSTGRFVSEDPARQGVNWTVYCGNDPANRLDYTGKWFWIAMFVIGAIVGILTYAVFCQTSGESMTPGGIVVSGIGGGLVAVMGALLGVGLAGGLTTALAGQIIIDAIVLGMFEVSICGGLGGHFKKMMDGPPTRLSLGPVGIAVGACLGQQFMIAMYLRETDGG